MSDFETPVPEMPTQPPTAANPLLARLQLPGETQRLPSQGLFYNDGELAPEVKNGEIHIHPMTAYDEIMIRSVDKLFSGDAVEEVFHRCIPQILKPKRLLAKDVDFLMVCLRKISYGAGFEMNYTHTCEDAKQHSYNIEMDEFIRTAKAIDPTTVAQKFTKTLENGQVVKIHPLRYDSVIKIMQSTEESLTEEQQTEMLIDSLLDVIEIVDEITDREFIKQWLEDLPIKWIQALSKAIDQSSDWGPDFKTYVVCKDCGEKTQIAAPMNPLTFFF